jgi:hypothetical protein
MVGRYDTSVEIICVSRSRQRRRLQVSAVKVRFDPVALSDPTAEPIAEVTPPSPADGEQRTARARTASSRRWYERLGGQITTIPLASTSVRSFSCDVCGRLLVFENSVCVNCGSAVGFDPARRRLVALPLDGNLQPCANLDLAGCNWVTWSPGGLCRCCALTRTRPADDDEQGLAAYARTEEAKRRLVFQLLDLGLPVRSRSEDADRGLAFDLLSSAQAPVTTGHADGVVTIDLAEGHDAHREVMRIQMAEPYRTLLGHLRHEVGHYYWQVLVEGTGLVPFGPGVLEEFRALFGDERDDYGQALQRHYASGPSGMWQQQYVSAYATAHPWEDWAETFAHYLHINDTLQTARAYGVVVTGPDQLLADAGELVAVPSEHPSADQPIETLVNTWLPLSYALNAVNRSMGKGDLYPFVLTRPVIDKLGLVHRTVHSAARDAGLVSP